ncbi:universal stress protein [Rhizobium sp. P32RR-XVIII]|uniref:universal stress protein n=1 Tax=Rhizobium sp. P32RR-XVIII TaxID=2726738 RepID=UPI001456646E|nr:universal stress protein [Rhizobium sp. P32RR-XVIII]NLS08301.1 universal stress protein [Rhizobium sp. P32RR-XVIII]
MTFKTILNVIAASQSDLDIKVAMDLCEEAGAHLAVFIVAMPPQLNGRYATLAPAWLEQRERIKRELAERAGQVRDRIAAAGLSFDVDTVYAEVAGAGYDIGERSLYTDLVVVGPEVFEDEDLKPEVVTGAIFHAGHPLLLIPRGGTPTLKPKTVVLAWDSRPQAAHAAREALEIMRAADSVHITMIDPVAALRASGDEPGADVATYLACHGVNVIVDPLPSMGREVAEILPKHALDIGAGMIVMGAYGRSRMREFVFGGTTRSVLNHAELPVLMVH